MSSHSKYSRKEAFSGEWGKEFLYDRTVCGYPEMLILVSEHVGATVFRSWPQLKKRTVENREGIKSKFAFLGVATST